MEAKEPSIMFEGPVVRPRRLRGTAPIRRLVSEHDVLPRHLVLPLFIKEGLERPQEIPSIPGAYQHTEKSVFNAVQEAVDAGVSGVMLFGVPASKVKDSTGSAAIDPQGILNRVTRSLSRRFGGQLVIMTDLCLDEFTDHGHCGVLDGEGRVDNEATLALYAKMAVVQAEAGAQVVAPSGMMDGQVAVIRTALDRAGYCDVVIMSYAVKYASVFYGPFRDAVDSSLQGSRKQYQMDPSNSREAVREAKLDLAEGADMMVVKPALSNLDIVYRIACMSEVPVVAYQVSGEYSMICAAADKGWASRQDAFYESFLAMRRAGADVIISYEALRMANIIKKMV